MPWPTPATPCAGHPPASCTWAATPNRKESKKAVVDAHQPPADYLRFVDRDEASRLAGWPLDAGGWWFPGGGWIQPPSLCAANLAAGSAGISTLFGRHLAQLAHQAEGCWRALDAQGNEIARAAVLVLANGVGIRALPQAASLPVRPARGQVSHLPASPGSAPEVVVCRLAM
jgi:tRNA 5-methylaminomethyl-2-thiouridine biosynthesis bifunctional protein